MTTFSEVLCKNIRAARARAGITQGETFEGMRRLGYAEWHRATVGNVENGSRRVLASELLGLAIVLETTVMRLMTPISDDGPIELPSGMTVSVEAIARRCCAEPDARQP